MNSVTVCSGVWQELNVPVGIALVAVAERVFGFTPGPHVNVGDVDLLIE